MRSIRPATSGRTVLIAILAIAILLLGPFSGVASAKTSTTNVRLYFLIDGKIAATTRTIPSTSAIGSAALDALFVGPVVNELAIGQRTALPVELASAAPLTIDQKTKTATVSLPSIFTSDDATLEAQRAAQIVDTLTQFPTVTSVSFVIDGKPYKPFNGEGKRVSGPVGRTDYEALTPAILIESVSSGNPLHVAGTANTFEATFQIELFDSGNAKLFSDYVTATSGTGSRGTFEKDVPYKVKASQTGTLLAYEASAKDGSHINVVAIPVLLSPK